MAGEQLLSKPTDLRDGKNTIGYGYTFNRNNNVAIFTAANITLTPAQWKILARIDAATTTAAKNALALTPGIELNPTTGLQLLEATIPYYENATSAAMPYRCR
jgi:hypothetical protein